jgi:hypothetical protein
MMIFLKTSFSLLIYSGEPRLAKMVHATVHENEYQVTIQAVFRKPENLSQSAFYIDETNGHYAMNSERSSTFSSTFNSDGIFRFY